MRTIMSHPSIDSHYLNTFRKVKVYEVVIEDAMRRDIAAPAFWGSAFHDPFRRVALLWLGLDDPSVDFV